MNAFAHAVDATFGDPNQALDAVWKPSNAAPGDPGVAVRIILRRPDDTGQFGETRVLVSTVMLHVRVSDVAVPGIGDTFAAVDGTVWRIRAEPVRDPMRLMWKIEASEEQP